MDDAARSKVAAAQEALEDARLAVSTATRRLLEAAGWRYSCDHPGGYWLWVRETDRGRVTAPTDLAVSMTLRALDVWPDEEADHG